MAYSIGTLFKTNKETLSDSSVKTVNAHKQLLKTLKGLFETAGWTVVEYLENYNSAYSSPESSVTSPANDEIEQRRLFVSNPDDDLYFVFETGSSFANDSYNIGVWTFPHYDASKDIHNQDFSNTKTILAGNDSLEYFLCLDGKRLYGFLYINNQFSSNFYLGYIDQFESKTNYPFAVLCRTQYTTTGFFNNIPASGGGKFPYYMGEYESNNEAGRYMTFNRGSQIDALNYCKYDSFTNTGDSFYGPDYTFLAWGLYCTGWANCPTNGEYTLGELFIKSVGSTTSSSTEYKVLSSMVLPGKIHGVYKISGYGLYTKYVVQFGGTPVTISDSSPASVKGYVDAIIASGGRAFVISNDLNLIGPQNFVALEMK